MAVKTRLHAAFLMALFWGCGRENMDRIALHHALEDKVWLTPMELKTDLDFDRLDEWLRGADRQKDVFKVYDDLLKLAPDNVKAHVRAALAIMEIDDRRGRAIGRAVLKRFRDREATDSDLQRLSERLGQVE